jgi:glucose/arabinose dehydrogenase
MPPLLHGRIVSMTPKSPCIIAVTGFFALALLGLTMAVTATPTQAVSAHSNFEGQFGSETLPPGVTTHTVLSNLSGGVVTMAFDPSGRLFFNEKDTGNVRLYANGALQATPVFHVATQGGGEQGLLGIAVDPGFTANRYVYIYWTCGSAAGCNPTLNKVTRFEENNGVGSDPVDIWSVVQTSVFHNGGNIHFGPDGKLYITVGDSGNAGNAQDVTSRSGKMHRIEPDGSIPADNPVFTQTGALPSLFAIGLRNSFDFDFDLATPMNPYPRIFASENGPNCDDELNRIEAGYNYGWRSAYPCDDADPDPTYNTISPLWYVPQGQCCPAPIAVTVYEGSRIPQWTNGLFMNDLNNTLYHFYLNQNRTLVTQANTVQGLSVGGDMETGPDGALWYFDLPPYPSGVNLNRLEGPGTGGTPTNTAVPLPTQTPGGPTATPQACTLQFADVLLDSTFYPFIHCLACKGYLGGYACGGVGEPCNPANDPYFRPQNNILRGQIAKIVSNAAGLRNDVPADRQTFEDVPPNSTFWLFVERLAIYGMMDGYACGRPGEPCVEPDNRPYFRPNNNATRGPIAKIVSNAAGFNENIPAGTRSFEDVVEGSTFHIYVERLLLNRPGVMSGYPCGGMGEPCLPPTNRPYFRPGSTATRGQVSKIVSNTFFPACLVP